MGKIAQEACFRQPELVSGSHNDWVPTRWDSEINSE